MVEPFYRNTWIEVDLDAIYHNITAIKKYVNNNQEIMAVVKANAYGHGAIPVAQEALAAGATWLAVALLEEAIELRKAGIEAPILIMGYIEPTALAIAHQYNVSVTISDEQGILDLLNYAKNISTSDGKVATLGDRPLAFHLKIDTGMNRLGVKNIQAIKEFIDTYLDYIKHCKGAPAIYWEGIFTHFATADELDDSYYQRQVRELQEIFPIILQRVEVPIVHAANSAAIFREKALPEINVVRVGIVMYGLYPSKVMQDRIPFPLRPALSLHSRLSHVKKVASNEGISYGAVYTTEEEEWIGTVPIGYADGWRRELSNQVDVLINGSRMKQVGRICMDQMMVKLDRSYPQNTLVTLIGKQGEEEISADEVAHLLQTINYEIPCMLSVRVPRIYMRAGERIERD